MTVMVTGAAGFIGSAVARQLCQRGVDVLGVDNLNNYYDPDLKEARLSLLSENKFYQHRLLDIADKKGIEDCFAEFRPDKVVNLAAQAGVRYSIEAPEAYITSNLVGFANILECCRQNQVEHLVYASSSSVYGANRRMPFSVGHGTDHPLSLYAASKKANEHMAHAYSHLYSLPTSGLRFFTVYGPWGRPDMALFKFTKAIISGEPIDVFNHGEHERDFTYIDDIVDGILNVLDKPAQPDAAWDALAPNPGTSLAPWRLYNIGCSNPVNLLDFIRIIEQALDRTAVLNLLPMQAGDVPSTFASVAELESLCGYEPKTDVSKGVNEFISWYKRYYNVD
jgi:UDP-glucuronate 4-epimerase